MMLSSSSDLPTCDAATMTILCTFGSVKARMGSSRYGVRLVRHGPASAELSGERRRCLSAHSSTVRLSGGAKRLIAPEMAALSFAAAFLVVRVIGELAPSLPIPYPPRIDLGIVFIAGQLLEDLVDLG